MYARQTERERENESACILFQWHVQMSAHACSCDPGPCTMSISGDLKRVRFAPTKRLDIIEKSK